MTVIILSTKRVKPNQDIKISRKTCEAASFESFINTDRVEFLKSGNKFYQELVNNIIPSKRVSKSGSVDYTINLKTRKIYDFHNLAIS